MKTGDSRLKLHMRLSVLTLVIGVVLMATQIYVEDEPGAIPLLLVVVGIGWLIVTRFRMRPQAEAGRHL